MTTLRRNLTPDRTTPHRRRGTVLIEFTLILPIFIFLILFSVDMGRLALISGGLSDATFSAARAGAAYGAADGRPLTGAGATPVASIVQFCPATFEELVDVTPTRRMYKAFCDVGSTIPAGPAPDKIGVVVNNELCGFAGTDFVVARGTMEIQFVTPGLGVLVTALSNSPEAQAIAEQFTTETGSERASTTYIMQSVAASRCEVERLGS